MKRNVSKVLSVLLIAALMLSFTAVASAETRMYATRAVNVRSGPSTSYYILGSLEQNEMVMATGRVYDGWYEIKWGSYGYAYVAGNYLSYSKYEPGYNPNYNCYPGNRGVTLKVCPDCRRHLLLHHRAERAPRPQHQVLHRGLFEQGSEVYRRRQERQLV